MKQEAYPKEQVDAARERVRELRRELAVVKEYGTEDQVDFYKEMIRHLNRIDRGEQPLSKGRKHHFLPKFYLKAWADPDADTHVWVRDLVLECVRHVGHRKEGQQKLYYGHPVNEDFLAMIDARSSRVLKYIRDHHRIPERQSYNDVNYIDMIVFLITQHSRVPRMADHTQAIIEGSLKWALETMNPDAGDVRVKQPHPQATAVKHAAHQIPFMDDLALHLITSESPCFITSDNPVFYYNQYNQKLSEATAAVDAHGFQAFCPISPYAVVLLYDPRIYELTTPKGAPAPKSIATSEDAEQINKMQILAATRKIYASTHEIADETLRYPDSLLDIRNINTHQVHKTSELYVFGNKMHDISLDLSCLRIRQDAALQPIWWRLRTYRHDSISDIAMYGWQESLHEFSTRGDIYGEIVPPPGWELAPNEHGGDRG